MAPHVPLDLVQPAHGLPKTLAHARPLVGSSQPPTSCRSPILSPDCLAEGKAPIAGVTPWLRALPARCQELFLDAVLVSDRRPSSTGIWDVILAAIHTPPSCAANQVALAQFFTPSDVALYSAFGLLSNYKGERVFDPCAGHGSLLIAAALVLAEKNGLTGTRLVSKIHGCEIDPATRAIAIDSLTAVLDILAPGIGPTNLKGQLETQITLGDFNQYPIHELANCCVISNPPYKEGPTGNVWIPIAEKLVTADIAAISLIVPVAIATSKRTQPLRNMLFEKFSTIKAFHHEIRPRPLFRSVDQRISIVTATKTDSTQREYITTGFLRHRAGERLAVWQAPETRLAQSDCGCVFPKVAPTDMDFFREFGAGSQRVCIADLGLNTGEDVWVRTTGRYHLLAQYARPPEVTSKWKKLRVPVQIVAQFVNAFSNGDLLRWWQIFGDGRDISITALQHGYGVRR